MIELILNIFLMVVAGISILIALLIGSSAIALIFTKVPFAPTPKRNVKLIIDYLNLKPGQIFYDLGCGDSRFLIEAEKRGAKAIGFEIAPWAYSRGKLNLLFCKSQAKIIFKNFFWQNISDADAVFCFLMDTIMSEVEKKLAQELKPGAKVICYGFKLPSWETKQIINLNRQSKRSSNVYIYEK